MKPLLSILLPTVKGREEKFDQLLYFLMEQGQRAGTKVMHKELLKFSAANNQFMINAPYVGEKVEIISCCDNKEISIGEKRDILYKFAIGEFSWMIDDDDSTHHLAIAYILHAIKSKPEASCIGFKELCIFNGKRVESSNFSLLYKEWADNVDGYNHVRTPFFKTPIKTELCQRVGVKDMRYGEDHQFAKDIYPLLKTQSYIDEFIYIYRHSDKEPHAEKYGIK